MILLPRRYGCRGSDYRGRGTEQVGVEDETQIYVPGPLPKPRAREVSNPAFIQGRLGNFTAQQRCWSWLLSSGEEILFPIKKKAGLSFIREETRHVRRNGLKF